MESEIPIEQEYYYIFNERYKGRMPGFFDESQFEKSKYIKDNYNNIKNEILNYLNKNLDNIESGLVLHSSRNGKGWKSIGLYVFNYKRKKKL